MGNKERSNGTIIEKYRFPSPHPLINVFLVTYISDGLKVKGFLAEPKENGCYPGLLYLRGGINHVGMVRIARIVQFAIEGFVVMAPFYRGNMGGEGFEDFCGYDRNDAIYAFDLLQSYEKVKRESIHVFGFSRGGVMALLVGIHRKDTATIVNWGGVTDMALTYNERVDLRRMLKRVIGGSPNKVPEQFKWRTPLHNVSEIVAPVLIIHGVKDKNVSVEHALKLEEELKVANKVVETWYFKNFTHYFPPQINRETVTKLTSWMIAQYSK